MISNLYKTKWREESQNIRKRRWWKKCNGKVKNSGEINRQRMRENVGGSVTTCVN